MKIQLPNDFKKSISRDIEKYNCEVGILEDKPYRFPLENSQSFRKAAQGTYAGGPVRKASRNRSDKTIGQILVENMVRMKRDILKEPFEKNGDKDMREFAKRFLDMALAKASKNRVTNLIQAMVRNPILKEKYGKNSEYTEDVKGFNRHLIDTAQTFKAIKARVINVRI